MHKGDLFPVDQSELWRTKALTKQPVMIQYTGEFRYPNEGEWFLSGAIVHGYFTTHNLTSTYPIGRLVTVEHKMTTVVKEVLSW